jgi:hypothetical protein
MDLYEQCKKDSNKNICLKVDALLKALPKKDAESLKKALLDENVSTRAIARVLEENNYTCGIWAINKWRKLNNVISKSTHAIEEKK